MVFLDGARPRTVARTLAINKSYGGCYEPFGSVGHSVVSTLTPGSGGTLYRGWYARPSLIEELGVHVLHSGEILVGEEDAAADDIGEALAPGELLKVDVIQRGGVLYEVEYRQGGAKKDVIVDPRGVLSCGSDFTSGRR